MNSILLLLCLVTVQSKPTEEIRKVLKQNIKTINKTRRILGGHQAGETRPYMVYLRPASGSELSVQDNNWLCAGVIIHEQYVLTSAACIEDAKQFYVVSGTHRWVPPSETNECINNGAKKAVWKCVPKLYYFDGNEFDNIRWMVRDIAVVKVEDEFNFKRRVRGCDFVPNKIAYNNISDDLEKPGTAGSIAGWGSTESFTDVLAAGRTDTVNSPDLLEADVVLQSKKNCKRRWDARYHHIIDEDMICAKDNVDSESMSGLCGEHEVNCTELVYSDVEEQQDTRRLVVDPRKTLVHTSSHGSIMETRRAKVTTGGFCENDHGGPLVVGRGKTAVVVGVISACQTFDMSLKCHGPYLYTSVYNNRRLINCAITKEMGETCRRLLRSMKTQMTETFFDWSLRAIVPKPVNKSVAVKSNGKNVSGTTKKVFRNIIY
ncbi:unnamed protein product [Chilo suppressalis]|uniref:Peptidase S1 domain-containing protein n=1 Tax=Chilo suppressalis TaxID=168631 RepID=A0ABN8B6T9_CHISP|nr:hypothetical protein evm_007088 [Chilo suppressalis]CAH0401618.1 unnamed protein product [Chilo suppressalis]